MALKAQTEQMRSTNQDIAEVRCRNTTLSVATLPLIRRVRHGVDRISLNVRGVVMVDLMSPANDPMYAAVAQVDAGITRANTGMMHLSLSTAQSSAHTHTCTCVCAADELLCVLECARAHTLAHALV